MNENLALDSDFTYETYQEQAPTVSATAALSGAAVTSLNGLGGPTVNLTGGATGLSFSVAAPNITLTGTLAVANGGTGGTTQATARSGLGLGTMAVANAIAVVADLSQTISATPTQGEVQAISDKVDELLAAMRTATHLTP